jgi:hypothetical protein
LINSNLKKYSIMGLSFKANWQFTEHEAGSSEATADEMTYSINARTDNNDKVYVHAAMSDGNNQPIRGVVFWTDDIDTPPTQTTNRNWKSQTWGIAKDSGNRTNGLYVPCANKLSSLEANVSILARVTMSEWDKGAHITVFWPDV